MSFITGMGPFVKDFKHVGFYCMFDDLWHGGHYPRKLWRYWRASRNLRGTLSHPWRERAWNQRIEESDE